MVSRTFDVEPIKRVMCSPEIFETVADDCMTPADFEPDVTGDCWLLAYQDEALIGAFHFHSLNQTTLQMHANILKAHRFKCARQACNAALQWIIKNAPDNYKKINIYTPVVYPQIINFIKKFGFKVEGIDRLSDTVKGLLCDRVMLGATFEEIKKNV